MFSKQVRDTDGNRLLVSDCQPHIVNKPADCSREEEVEFDYKLVTRRKRAQRSGLRAIYRGTLKGRQRGGPRQAEGNFELRFDRGLAPAPAGSILARSQH